MSSIRIQRTDHITDFLQFNPETSEVSKELLNRVGVVFRAFQEEQKTLQERLNVSLSQICLDPRNKELLSFMERRFTIPLTEEQIILIVKIVAFIKKQDIFTLNKIDRYKINDLCSISIYSNTTLPSLDDTIFIHLKKKITATLFGEGSRSKAYKALQFSKDQFSWIAEKTTYKMIETNLNSATLELNPKLFLNPPLFSYLYLREAQTSEGYFEVIAKQCSLEPLYDLSLAEIIDAHKHTPFLTESTVWGIALQLIEMIKELHDKNLIYRDLKPDNILVSLDKADGTFDFNKFSLVAADLDTVIQEDAVPKKWVGTRWYFPKNTNIEQQKKPSDIYALGKILGMLFGKNFGDKLYISKVIDLISQMSCEEFKERPTIDDVRAQFLALRPSHFFSLDETIDCISLKDCVIL